MALHKLPKITLLARAPHKLALTKGTTNNIIDRFKELIIAQPHKITTNIKLLLSGKVKLTRTNLKKYTKELLELESSILEEKIERIQNTLKEHSDLDKSIRVQLRENLRELAQEARSIDLYNAKSVNSKSLEVETPEIKKQYNDDTKTDRGLKPISSSLGYGKKEFSYKFFSMMDRLLKEDMDVINYTGYGLGRAIERELGVNIHEAKRKLSIDGINLEKVIETYAHIKSDLYLRELYNTKSWEIASKNLNTSVAKLRNHFVRGGFDIKLLTNLISSLPKPNKNKKSRRKRGESLRIEKVLDSVASNRGDIGKAAKDLGVEKSYIYFLGRENGVDIPRFARLYGNEKLSGRRATELKEITRNMIEHEKLDRITLRKRYLEAGKNIIEYLKKMLRHEEYTPKLRKLNLEFKRRQSKEGIVNAVRWLERVALEYKHTYGRGKDISPKKSTSKKTREERPKIPDVDKDAVKTLDELKGNFPDKYEGIRQEYLSRAEDNKEDAKNWLEDTILLLYDLESKKPKKTAPKYTKKEVTKIRNELLKTFIKEKGGQKIKWTPIEKLYSGYEKEPLELGLKALEDIGYMERDSTGTKIRVTQKAIDHAKTTMKSAFS